MHEVLVVLVRQSQAVPSSLVLIDGLSTSDVAAK
jgi:hypothetical protein